MGTPEMLKVALLLLIAAVGVCGDPAADSRRVLSALLRGARNSSATNAATDALVKADASVNTELIRAQEHIEHLECMSRGDCPKKEHAEWIKPRKWENDAYPPVYPREELSMHRAEAAKGMRESYLAQLKPIVASRERVEAQIADQRRQNAQLRDDMKQLRARQRGQQLDDEIAVRMINSEIEQL